MIFWQNEKKNHSVMTCLSRMVANVTTWYGTVTLRQWGRT